MTREEEIERASVHHLYQYDYSYEEGEHLDFYIKGFTEGAKWADEHPNLSSLWHDVKEEPQGDGWTILCQNEYGTCFVVEHRPYESACDETWNEYANSLFISKWIYIKDILPKKI